MITWYLLLSLFFILLTYLLWIKQFGSRQKHWLIKQIQNDPDQHLFSINALRQQKQATSKGHLAVLLMLFAILPMSGLVQSLWFDNQQPENTTVAPDLTTAITQLKQKLAQNPDDIQGQLLYAQSMATLKNYHEAVLAYQKANELQPDDPAILTEWAEAIAFRNNTGSFLGEPVALLQQVLSINPNHQKAMWLYGIVLYEQQQYAEAEKIWTELLGMVSSSGIQETLIQQINQARQAQGLPDYQPALSSLYQVIINSDSGIPESAVLFVFAKEVNGPPMPIAAKKITGPLQFPYKIQLDESDSLQPDRPLTNFIKVNISAHISLTGSADDKSWQSEMIEAYPKQKYTLTLKRTTNER